MHMWETGSTYEYASVCMHVCALLQSLRNPRKELGTTSTSPTTCTHIGKYTLLYTLQPNHQTFCWTAWTSNSSRWSFALAVGETFFRDCGPGWTISDFLWYTRLMASVGDLTRRLLLRARRVKTSFFELFFSEPFDGLCFSFDSEIWVLILSLTFAGVRLETSDRFWSGTRIHCCSFRGKCRSCIFNLLFLDFPLLSDLDPSPGFGARVEVDFWSDAATCDVVSFPLEFVFDPDISVALNAMTFVSVGVQGGEFHTALHFSTSLTRFTASQRFRLRSRWSFSCSITDASVLSLGNTDLVGEAGTAAGLVVHMGNYAKICLRHLSAHKVFNNMNARYHWSRTSHWGSWYSNFQLCSPNYSPLNVLMNATSCYHERAVMNQVPRKFSALNQSKSSIYKYYFLIG